MWALCGNLSSIIKFKELHLPGDTVNSKDKLDPNKFEQNFGPNKIWSKKKYELQKIRSKKFGLKLGP